MDKITSHDIVKALRKRYDAYGHWLLATEVRLGTGYVDTKKRYALLPDGRYGKLPSGSMTTIDQRIDVFAMSCWPSDHFRKIAFEVKVTRQDFKREIDRPVKRAGALAVSNMFYFVVPEGLVKAPEVPDECGLMVLKGDQLRVVKKAPCRECPEPSWGFIASFNRRLADDALITKVVLNDEHKERLTAEVAYLQEQLAREREKVEGRDASARLQTAAMLAEINELRERAGLERYARWDEWLKTGITVSDAKRRRLGVYDMQEESPTPSVAS